MVQTTTQIEISKKIYRYDKHYFRLITCGSIEPREFAEENIVNELTVESSDRSYVFTRENEIIVEELIPGHAIKKGDTKGIDQLKIE